MTRRQAALILIAAPQDMRPELRQWIWELDYRTLLVHSGPQALRALHKYRPDALILSLALPGIDPWEVLRRVRDLSDLPIVIADRTYRVAHVVRALDLGADDYVTPASPAETYSPRLRARLRRGACLPDPEHVIDDGWLSIDLATHEAAVDGRLWT